MQSKIKESFDQFVSKKKMNDMEAEEEEGDAKKGPDFQVYRDIMKFNGKTGGQVFAALLSTVFEAETTVLDTYLVEYLELLVDSKILKGKDFNEGVSKHIQMLPDLVMDIPLMPNYVWKYIISTLLRRN